MTSTLSRDGYCTHLNLKPVKEHIFRHVQSEMRSNKDQGSVCNAYNNVDEIKEVGLKTIMGST